MTERDGTATRQRGGPAGKKPVVRRAMFIFELGLNPGSVRIVRCHSGNPRLLAALSLLWLELVNKTETGTGCFNSDYRLNGSRKEGRV